jgi:hypothetical protein
MTSATDTRPLVKYSVCFYRGDDLVREVEIRGLPVEDLRRIVGMPPDDPMCDCYPIGIPELKRLSPHCPEPLPQELGPQESAFVQAFQA